MAKTRQMNKCPYQSTAPCGTPVNWPCAIITNAVVTRAFLFYWTSLTSLKPPRAKGLIHTASSSASCARLKPRKTPRWRRVFLRRLSAGRPDVTPAPAELRAFRDATLIRLCPTFGPNNGSKGQQNVWLDHWPAGLPGACWEVLINGQTGPCRGFWGVLPLRRIVPGNRDRKQEAGPGNCTHCPNAAPLPWQPHGVRESTGGVGDDADPVIHTELGSKRQLSPVATLWKRVNVGSHFKNQIEKK